MLDRARTAGDACKYAHVRARTRVCRSIINIIAVARDEEALAVSLRSCPARPPLPSPYKEKIPRRGNQRFYTWASSRRSAGRPAARRGRWCRERKGGRDGSEGRNGERRCPFPSSATIGKTRGTMYPTYLPTLEDYRSPHLFDTLPFLPPRGLPLRVPDRSRTMPACRIQILDSDSGLTVVPGRASLANPTECRNVCLLCISLFSPDTNGTNEIVENSLHLIATRLIDARSKWIWIRIDLFFSNLFILFKSRV